MYSVRPLDTGTLFALRPHLPALARIWDLHAPIHVFGSAPTPTLLLTPATYRPRGETPLYRLRVLLPIDARVQRVWLQAGPDMAAYLTAQGLATQIDLSR